MKTKEKNQAMVSKDIDKQAVLKGGRNRSLTGVWWVLTTVLSCLGLLLACYHIFHLEIGGIVFMDNAYMYLLMAIYLSMVFLFFPFKKGLQGRLPFAIDVVLFFTTLVICSYFANNGYDIIYKGWGYRAPLHVTFMGIVMWCLLLEALRRTVGTSLAVIVLFFSLYPLFANYMPGFLEGSNRSVFVTANYHLFSVESVLGIPLKVFGTVLIGFLVFGIVLQSSGGGNFFLDLASSLLGAKRGGTAKMAVLASALFGSLSGSVISNVVTTGAITIPAIKKSGYPAHYAGGIECVASTGGVLMPPVMGATAFVMAAFLGVTYGRIALAAMVPSLLVYFGLLIQVDCYAAKNNLMGVPKEELPALWGTFKAGWFYILAMTVLLYVLFELRMESEAPFYATAILIPLAMIRPATRFSVKSFFTMIQKTGILLCELIAILAGVGMILGGLAVTGVAASFAREIVSLAGGSTVLMLIFGAAASFVLGMGMTITACYVFLAMVLVPGLVLIGLNELAVNLYVMYWGMFSFITPPVALASFPAAVLAESSPVKVGLTAMRLGVALYIIPIFFIFDPSLLFEGNLWAVLQSSLTAFLGIFVIASASQNYMMGIGVLASGNVNKIIVRILLFTGGFIMGFHGWTLDLIGLAVIGIGLLYAMVLKKTAKREIVATT